MLHFMGRCLKFVWFASFTNDIWSHSKTFIANRKNEYAKCAVHVLGHVN